MSKNNFWKNLKKPILALAPMANVTDAPFRYMIAKYSAPAEFVSWTEFVSVEALLSEGREMALLDFIKLDNHTPTVAQIFGSKPDQFERVAAQIEKAGVFDGIDINMGCPDKGVEKSGAGSALIKNPKLAQLIIKATKKGAPNLPVSVKTRLGYNQNQVEEWTKYLLETEPAALIMHLRTRKQMSKVSADWTQIEAMKKVRDRLFGSSADAPPLLGNGDVGSVAHAKQLCEQHGADGAMIGRGIFGTPWFFAGVEKTTEESLTIMLEHTKLYADTFGPNREGRAAESVKTKDRDWLKSFDYMKKHYKAYCSDFDGAKELRMQLMEAETYDQIEDITRAWLKSC